MYPQANAVLDRLRADAEAAFAGYSGPILDDPAYALTHGGCALYAVAVAARTGWPIISVGQASCCGPERDGLCCAFGAWDGDHCAQYGDGHCQCHAHHFYVETPDGYVLDAYGEHDPSALVPGSYESFHSWTDKALACVLETWHVGVAEDADVVLGALEEAARLDAPSPVGG